MAGIRFYGYTLAAGASEKIYAAGSYVRAITASDRFDIRPDGGAVVSMESGLGYSFPDSFRELEVVNTSGAPQFIELAISAGRVDDSRLSLSGVLPIRARGAVSSTVKTKQSITVATAVLAANANRMSALVDLSAPAYIGSVADGPLMPTGKFVWESEAALTLVPASGTVVVRIVEDERV